MQREMRKTFLVPSLREEQRLQQSCRICRSLKVFSVELKIKSTLADHKLFKDLSKTKAQGICISPSKLNSIRAALLLLTLIKNS